MARNPGLSNNTEYGAVEFPLPTRPASTKIRDKAALDRDQSALERDKAVLERDLF